MKNNEIVRVVGFDGKEITKLTIDEFNILIKNHQELSSMSKEAFETYLLLDNRKLIYEEFIGLIDPCHQLEDKKTGESLNKKLKDIGINESVSIMDTLFKADSFNFMFRFYERDADVEEEFSETKTIIVPETLKYELSPEQIEKLKNIDVSQLLKVDVIQQMLNNINSAPPDINIKK